MIMLLINVNIWKYNIRFWSKVHLSNVSVFWYMRSFLQLSFWKLMKLLHSKYTLRLFDCYEYVSHHLQHYCYSVFVSIQHSISRFVSLDLINIQNLYINYWYLFLSMEIHQLTLHLLEVFLFITHLFPIVHTVINCFLSIVIVSVTNEYFESVIIILILITFTIHLFFYLYFTILFYFGIIFSYILIIVLAMIILKFCTNFHCFLIVSSKFTIPLWELYFQTIASFYRSKLFDNCFLIIRAISYIFVKLEEFSFSQLSNQIPSVCLQNEVS